jgi:hypothetical protein
MRLLSLKTIATSIILLAVLAGCQTTTIKETRVKQSLKPMERPMQWTKGSSYETLVNGTDKRKSEVIAADEATLTWKGPDGCVWVRTKDHPFAAWKSWNGCTFPDGTNDIERIEDTPIWPLKVGNKWSYRQQGSNVEGRTWETVRTCEVPEETRIKTALGEFDTFKVVCDDDWNRYTWYIAPSYDMTVYYEYFRKGENSTRRHETIRFTKP